MNKISANFYRAEFACKCGCGKDTVDHELVRVLEDVRSHFGRKAVFINSGNRCLVYNNSICGSVGSWHLKGRAVDFVVKGVEPHFVQEYLLRRYPDRYGIGRYDKFTHLDTRGYKARWDERQHETETDSVRGIN